MSSTDELACTYAALMLADDGVTITVSSDFNSQQNLSRLSLIIYNIFCLYFF